MFPSRPAKCHKRVTWHFVPGVLHNSSCRRVLYGRSSLVVFLNCGVSVFPISDLPNRMAMGTTMFLACVQPYMRHLPCVGDPRTLQRASFCGFVPRDEDVVHHIPREYSECPRADPHAQERPRGGVTWPVICIAIIL